MGKRKSTKYPGVQARESEERRFRGRPDICYTIDYKDATGKRVRKDVGWASQGFSAALASEMRSRLVNEAKTAIAMGGALPPQGMRCPNFGEAWEKYKKDWLLANGKDAKYPTSLISNHLAGFLSLPLNEITAYRIDKLMNTMRSAGLAPQSVRNTVGLVRSIMRRMMIWKLYNGPLPFADITLPKLNNARERFLTAAEARALLEELRKRSGHTWMMALISLHCGLRFGEIAHLRWQDIDFQNMNIFIAESKSGKARHSVMTEEVAKAFCSLAPGNKTDLIFPSRTGGVMDAVSKVFFRAVDAVGLNDTGEIVKKPDGSLAKIKITDRRQKVVFHTLRHTYASWLAKGGLGQTIIADRLGHHSLQMSMRYTHLMDESRKASAEAISRIFHDDLPKNQS